MNNLGFQLILAAPGNRTPQPDAYNAHIKKLDLAKRFPLAKIALKKCAGG